MNNQFKTLRKSRGLTQQQVADKLGITRQAYNHYETGRRKPQANMLKVMAELFGCSIDQILEYEPIGVSVAENYSPVPILGSVRAGYNLLAREECEGYELVDVANPNEYFLLHVTGDSMEPHIHSGDMALVHMQNDVESGEIAVVLIDDEEATLKRVVKSGKQVALQPFNPAYEVRVFSGSSRESLRILGKVVKTTRSW